MKIISCDGCDCLYACYGAEKQLYSWKQAHPPKKKNNNMETRSAQNKTTPEPLLIDSVVEQRSSNVIPQIFARHAWKMLHVTCK